MRMTNYGLWTNEEEPNQNEIALEYIREVKKELDGIDLMNSGIPLDNKFFCDLFLQLFKKYPPTIVDIADFIKKVKGEYDGKN